MTLSTALSRVDALGNGSATVFSFAPIVIFTAADLQVTKRDAAGSEIVIPLGTGSANFSLLVTTLPGTGAISYPASGGTPLATGERLTIKRVVPLLQSVHLTNHGAYLAEVQEAQYDYLTAIDQQQQEQLNRTLQLTLTDPAIPLPLPTATQRANKVLGFDSSGNPVATSVGDQSALTVTATRGTSASTLAQRFSHALNVIDDFGAHGDGVTDDTAAIQAAINTGQTVHLPPGSYRVTNALQCSTPGQIITGAGIAATSILVHSDFNMSAAGVFNVTIPQNVSIQGMQIRDLGIFFAQPDTASRGSLVNYPPGIYAQNVPHCTFQGVRVNAAIIAIDIRGGTGGSCVLDCKLCAFSAAVAIDGSLDTITLQNLRCENDLLTANQTLIYLDPATIGIWCGRCDGLIVNHAELLSGTGAEFYQSASGAALALMSDCAFDGSGIGLNLLEGAVQVSNSYFSGHTATSTCVSIQSGRLTITGCSFQAALVPFTTGHAFVLAAASGSTKHISITLSGCLMECFVGDMNFIFIAGTGGGGTDLTLTGNKFFNTPEIAIVNAMVASTGSLITMTGNRFAGTGSTGSGHALTVDVDGYHNITGNSFIGLQLGLPVGHSILIAANNN